MIKITCKTGTLKNINDLKPFQGNIKSMRKKDREKLIHLLETYGIRFPFYTWNDNIINGHQRYDILKNDFNYTGDVPVVEIEAENEAEAKELVLVATSQHGRFNIEELEEFTKGLTDLDSMALLDGPNISLDFKPKILEEEPKPLSENIELVDSDEYQEAEIEQEVEEIKTQSGQSIKFPDGSELIVGDDRYFAEEVVRMWNNRNRTMAIQL